MKIGINGDLLNTDCPHRDVNINFNHLLNNLCNIQ